MNDEELMNRPIRFGHLPESDIEIIERDEDDAPRNTGKP
jgi:hypothetical protein